MLCRTSGEMIFGCLGYEESSSKVLFDCLHVGSSRKMIFDVICYVESSGMMILIMYLEWNGKMIFE
jgi:hypothetical protein